VGEVNAALAYSLTHINARRRLSRFVSGNA